MGIEIGFIIGIAVVGLAVVFGLVSYSRRNRANAPVTQEATRELYKDEDAFERKEGEFRARTD